MNAETRLAEVWGRARGALPFGPGAPARLFAAYHRAHIRTGRGTPVLHLVGGLLCSLYAMHYAHLKHELDHERAELHKYY